jgi:SAM-dependent methyltransferase
MTGEPKDNFSASDYRTWKDWDPASFGRYADHDAVGFRRELEMAGVALNGPLCVFEVGFGNGQFAVWAKSQGWSVVGTELDSELVARASAAGIEAHGIDRPIDAIAGERRFDVIVAFDVFEHLTIDQLQVLLNSARRCLKPGGRIVARFPSGDSPFGRSVQHSDLTHKMAIGTGIVHQLANRVGLRVLQIRAPVLPVLGVGAPRGLRRLAVLGLRKAITAVINLAFHDGQPLVVARNMVVVLEQRD